MDLDVSLSLPRETATVGLIRRVTAAALDTLGVRRPCIDDVVLALSEACSNVVLHAAEEDEYEVHLRIAETCCAITIKDTGGGFDAAALADVAPDATSVGGRGVSIMRAVVDNVAFDSEPERGTIVHLVKSLAVKPGSPLTASAR